MWLATTASAGISRNVGLYNLDANISSSRLLRTKICLIIKLLETESKKQN